MKVLIYFKFFIFFYTGKSEVSTLKLEFAQLCIFPLLLWRSRGNINNLFFQMKTNNHIFNDV